MAYTVIDVSVWNGDIDWETAKKHIDGAIIRCGYGSDYTSQDDQKWARNVSECERLGIPYGVYLYSYAKNVDMAKSEAKHALRLLKGHNPSYPVYFDMEESVSNAGALCDAFCKEIEAAGYKAGLYSYQSYYNQYLDGYDNYTIWMAAYGTNDGKKHAPPQISVGYDAWQYTSVGKIPGINGNVDLSEFYFGPEGGNMAKINVADIAAKIHANMCDDDRFGYSWEPRWGTDGAGYATWNIQGRDYTVKCGDYDCSSSVITAWQKALEGTAYEGALDGATYTGNMRRIFTSSGLFDTWVTQQTWAERGDVYLNEANHTAMCQDGGSDNVYGYDCLSEFSINENGGTYGGRTGDQTGRESYIHGYYNYPWDITLHYNGKADYSRKDDNMPLTDTDISRIWEYTYRYGTENEDSTLGKRGVDTNVISNRYNVLNAAYSKAKKTLAKVEELEAKIDTIKQGGVDYELLAKAVADELSKRMKE